MKLSKEEKALLNVYETAKSQSTPQLKKTIKKYSAYARSTLQKNKRINIRMAERDLLLLQMKAVQEGMPYQTLISSILHKYVMGNLKDLSK